MNNSTDIFLDDRHSIQLEQIAAVLERTMSGIATEINAAPDFHWSVTRIPDVRSPLSTLSATAVTAHWTWQSITQGPRLRSATIIQVVEGGLTGGEGWACYSQYVCPTAVQSADHLRLLAELVINQGIPIHAFSGDL